MARPPQISDLELEAAKDPEKLVQWLNDAMGPVRSALGGNLTVTDNLDAEWFTTPNAVAVPTDWTTIEVGQLHNSFLPQDSVQYPIQYRKATDGTVHLRGLVKIPSGPPAASTPILTLPYPPDAARILITSTNSAAFCLLGLRADGVVIVGTSLTAGQYIDLTCSYQAADRSPVPPSCFPYLIGVDPSRGRPKAVLLAEVREKQTGAQLACGCPSWDYVMVSGDPQVSIRNVPGLVPGRSYFMTFLILWR